MKGYQGLMENDESSETRGLDYFYFLKNQKQLREHLMHLIFGKLQLKQRSLNHKHRLKKELGNQGNLSGIKRIKNRLMINTNDHVDRKISKTNK